MNLPQLSLRELFLLVVIAAMGCGLWVEHRKNGGLEWELETLSARTRVLESQKAAIIEYVQEGRGGMCSFVHDPASPHGWIILLTADSE